MYLWYVVLKVWKAFWGSQKPTAAETGSHCGGTGGNYLLNLRAAWANLSNYLTPLV